MSHRRKKVYLKLNLLKEFYNTKFAPGLDVLEHFDKITKLSNQFLDHQVADPIAMLLFSISENYSKLVESLLENERSLTLGLIKSRLFEEELEDKVTWSDLNKGLLQKKEPIQSNSECDFEMGSVFVKTELTEDDNPLNFNSDTSEIEVNQKFKSDKDSEEEFSDETEGSEYRRRPKRRTRKKGNKKPAEKMYEKLKIGQRGKYECPECDEKKIFLRRKNFERHLYLEHKKTLKQVEKILSISYGVKVSPYLCEICCMTFTLKKRFDEHIKVHGKDGSLKSQCEVCKTYWATDKFTLKEHYLAEHKDNITCKTCKKDFINVKATQSHIKNSHTNSELSEDLKLKVTTLKNKISFVKKSDEPMKKVQKGEFICIECEAEPKILKDRYSFERHLYLVHKKTLLEITEILKIQFNVEASKYICKFCGRTYNRKDHLQVHVNSHGKDGNLKFRCNCCPVFFGASKEDLTQHLQAIHTKQVTCSICNLLFEDPNKLRSHRLKNHIVNFDKVTDEPYVKPVAMKVIPQVIICTDEKNNDNSDDNSEAGNDSEYEKESNCSQQDQQNESNSIKKPRLEFQCTEHDKNFLQIKSYVRHLITDHSKTLEEICEYLKKSFDIDSGKMCTICYKVYASYAKLAVHIRCHGDDGSLRIRCYYCPTYVASKSDLKKHNLEKHSERITCNICNETHDRIGEHKRTVHGEKRLKRKLQYICKNCGMEFTNKPYLRNHEESNCGQDPLFKCDQCDKAFMYAMNLKQHMMIHTGELPYQCTFCFKGFRQKHAKLRHETIHTGEKSFKCTVCDFATSYQNNLLNHMSIHTGIKRYKCNSCNDSFSCFSGLKAHYNNRKDSCGSDPNRTLKINPSAYIGYRQGEIVFEKKQ